MPNVTCEYYDVTTPESKRYSNSLTSEDLQPDTTYSVRVRINQSDRYCQTDYSSPITVTTAPAQTTLPAGGLDLAYGSVSIGPGENGKLSIRYNNEIYSIDSSTDIRLTGKWTGTPDSYEAPVSVVSGANAHIILSNVVIEGSSEAHQRKVFPFQVLMSALRWKVITASAEAGLEFGSPVVRLPLLVMVPS